MLFDAHHYEEISNQSHPEGKVIKGVISFDAGS